MEFWPPGARSRVAEPGPMWSWCSGSAHLRAVPGHLRVLRKGTMTQPLRAFESCISDKLPSRRLVLGF
jgi:hypothetical protein